MVHSENYRKRFLNLVLIASMPKSENDSFLHRSSYLVTPHYLKQIDLLFLPNFFHLKQLFIHSNLKFQMPISISFKKKEKRNLMLHCLASTKFIMDSNTMSKSSLKIQINCIDIKAIFGKHLLKH